MEIAELENEIKKDKKELKTKIESLFKLKLKKLFANTNLSERAKQVLEFYINKNITRLWIEGEIIDESDFRIEFTPVTMTNTLYNAWVTLKYNNKAEYEYDLQIICKYIKSIDENQFYNLI